MTKFSFDNLFILDMANNHQGELQHGLNIIDAMAKVAHQTNIRAAIKFQFRQLETFIHPDYVERKDIKHIPRFIETRLSLEDYEKLILRVREHGLFTMCTPFDEESVDVISQMDFDAIKIASCSVTDRPLLEKVVSAKKPVIASTGGASLSDIEFLAHLLRSSSINYALEHCVSIYPTPAENLQLNQIGYLRNHFGGVPIGWSTHEDPDDLITVGLAVAKGATLFERHVGISDNDHKLNAYSSTPQQVHEWVLAYQKAVERCGSKNRAPALIEESESLRTLARGIYLSKDVKKDTLLKSSDVLFAMPAVEGCLLSGQWSASIVTDKDYSAGESLNEAIANADASDDQHINQIMLQVQGMLQDAKIQLNNTSNIEISHHYGLKRFREYGAIIIDVINREYCKKLIIQLPRQKHPYHFHKQKEETFQVLYGEMEVEKNGNPTILKTGDLFLVEPGNWHKFSTLDGVIFEEISTTHINSDSYYEDQRINDMPREARKTVVTNW